MATTLCLPTAHRCRHRIDEILQQVMEDSGAGLMEIGYARVQLQEHEYIWSWKHLEREGFIFVFFVLDLGGGLKFSFFIVIIFSPPTLFSSLSFY